MLSEDNDGGLHDHSQGGGGQVPGGCPGHPRGGGDPGGPACHAGPLLRPPAAVRGVPGED